MFYENPHIISDGKSIGNHNLTAKNLKYFHLNLFVLLHQCCLCDSMPNCFIEWFILYIITNENKWTMNINNYDHIRLLDIYIYIYIW